MPKRSNLKGRFWLFYIVLSSGLVFSATAAGTEHTRPEFDGQGRIVILSRTDGPGLEIRIFEPSSGKSETRNLSGAESSLPKVRKDSQGRLWGGWVETGAASSPVTLGMVDENLLPRFSFKNRIDPSLPWNYAFDDRGTAWLIWIKETQGGRSVWVENGLTGTSWIVSSASEEACSPQLLVDAKGMIWAFWSAVDTDREQVLSSTYDGSGWSKELRLSSSSGTPNIMPQAAAARNGGIWLVWSGYDGHDYEIMCRMWDGRSWSPASSLTDNKEANDVFPRLDLALSDVPVVSWVRFTERGREEWFRCWHPGGWLEEKKLPPSSDSQPFVPLAVHGEMAALVEHEAGSFRIESFFLPQIDGCSSTAGIPSSDEKLSRRTDSSELPSLIFNPSLKENVFIAFGDSITSGVCDENGIDEPTDYVPEKAYPPRLEAILSQHYGTHKVINEGWPGESTFQGLARFNALLVKHQARYILILEGTNDIIWDDYSLDTTIFNLKEMLRRSLEYGLLPALATCIPKFGRNAFPIKLTNLNARIRLLAAERPVPLVDLNKDFAEYPEEDGGPTSLYCWGEDRTHPNDKGSQFMAEKWFERIRNFPFPPADPAIRRAYDEILFYRKEGNLLEWKDNPKIFAREGIQEYRIYRKKNSESVSSFRLLTTVKGRTSYFDSDIQPNIVYAYVVSTVMSDQGEGPGTPLLIQ